MYNLKNIEKVLFLILLKKKNESTRLKPQICSLSLPNRKDKARTVSEFYKTKTLFPKTVSLSISNPLRFLSLSYSNSFHSRVLFSLSLSLSKSQSLSTVQMAMNLTEGAIMKMCRGELKAEDEGVKPILQVIEVMQVVTKAQQQPSSSSSTERYRVVLSDGTHQQQGMLATQKNHFVKDGKLQKGSIVRLTHFVCNEVQRRMSVTQSLIPYVGFVFFCFFVFNSRDMILGLRRQLQMFIYLSIYRGLF